MARGDLTDDEWSLIDPHLPLGERGPIPDLRQQFNAVMWRFRTGSPWRDLPQEYGPWSTVYDRFRSWATAGVFEELMQAMDAGEGRRTGKRATPKGQNPRDGEPGDDGKREDDRRRLRRRRRIRLTAAGLGRSRGGLTSKVHLSADRRCRPLSFVLTPGQAGDSPQFRTVLARIKVRLPVGRPRTRLAAVAADKAYSSRGNRLYLRRRHIKAVIPEKSDQAANRKNRGSRGGRPISHDPELYKQRNTAERCINRIKEWRGLAFRFDKTPDSYLAGLHLRGAILWIRSLQPI